MYNDVRICLHLGRASADMVNVTSTKSMLILIVGSKHVLFCQKFFVFSLFILVFKHKVMGDKLWNLSKIGSIVWQIGIYQRANRAVLLQLRCIRPPQSQSRTNNFLKHQCALMDHNIFMKQIGSIVVILN